MIVIEARSGRIGGALNVIVELLPRLEKALRARGEEVVTFAGPARGLISRLQRRTSFCRAKAILHLGNRSTIAPRARKVLCLRDRVLLAHLVAGRPFSVRFWVRRILMWLGMLVADVVVVPSASMVAPVSTLQKKLRRTRSTPIVVIHHGRPTWLKPEDRPFDDPVKLLYPSHVAWHKNFELLAGLMAVSQTLPRAVTLTLTAMGSERVAHRPLAEIFGSGTQVRFIGVVDRDALPTLYAEHDVLLFPSHLESFGSPLVEAMVMGMPIVASDRPWAREICAAAALYADPSQVSAWERALTNVLQKGMRSNQAAADQVGRFDWDRAAISYADLLDDRAVTP